MSKQSISNHGKQWIELINNQIVVDLNQKKYKTRKNTIKILHNIKIKVLPAL